MSTKGKGKQNLLTSEFTKAAIADKEGALAYMIMSSFGATLKDIQMIVSKVAEAKDVQMTLLMLAAAVQVRSNVVFVGNDFAGAKAKYPKAIIDGTREVDDVWNYGVIHAAGHMIAMMTTNALGPQILKKAGNCVGGGNFTENEAGRINKEIHDSWTPEDKRDVLAWVEENKLEMQKVFDPIINSIKDLSTKFQSGMNPVSKPKPVAEPSTAAEVKKPTTPGTGV